MRLCAMTWHKQYEKVITVQPRALHLLQSPYKHINLAKKESAPRRRRFGIGRFRNREAEG